MKTSSTSALQYSGYPLPLIEAEKEKNYLQVIKIEKPQNIPITPATNKQIDDPSNWDESWFNNYE